MDIPPGYMKSSKIEVVCKLQKALYGLKQSPRAWFGKFTKAVKQYGYVQCQSDHTLFLKHTPCGDMTALIVYVDDIVITGNNDGEIQKLKGFLANEFEVKDLGNLRYFLGMEVARSPRNVFQFHNGSMF